MPTTIPAPTLEAPKPAAPGMPNPVRADTPRHTDDMQDIISTVPSWLLRWGITIFFCVLILIIGLSAFIQYPDMISAQLKIDSPNAAKPVAAKISGKLTRLLVAENTMVKAQQPLAYLESTANHDKVLILLKKLEQLQKQVLNNHPINTLDFNQANNTEFGELQAAYQVFYTEYLSYLSSVNNGFLIKKKSFLEKDLLNINKQQQQLYSEKAIEQRDYNLAQQEFDMHKKLEEQKVETRAEFRQQESKYLAKKSPLVQTDESIINTTDTYTSKQKEILELNNQIQEEKGKFLQALNSLISAAEDWKSKYVLTASQDGRVTYVGIVQENQLFTPNQEVFYINPGNEQFFGEMTISQDNIGKVKVGQQVLIKLRGYPFEEYGMIRGKIKYIADLPYKDSVFVSKVDFSVKNSHDLKKSVHLKQGMIANAEIITENASILQRIGWSLLRMKRD
jgi:multidrug efflux pump subunit AcrA (membrane-fusion protein)